MEIVSMVLCPPVTLVEPALKTMVGWEAGFFFAIRSEVLLCKVGDIQQKEVAITEYHAARSILSEELVAMNIPVPERLNPSKEGLASSAGRRV
jgi:hypothetical protein